MSEATKKIREFFSSQFDTVMDTILLFKKDQITGMDAARSIRVLMDHIDGVCLEAQDLKNMSEDLKEAERKVLDCINKAEELLSDLKEKEDLEAEELEEGGDSDDDDVEEQVQAAEEIIDQHDNLLAELAK